MDYTDPIYWVRTDLLGRVKDRMHGGKPCPVEAVRRGTRKTRRQRRKGGA